VLPLPAVAKTESWMVAFFAGALGTGDFLLLVDDDFFELGLAVVADVFVDRHSVTPVDSL
jgi:hypothetical protein